MNHNMVLSYDYATQKKAATSNESTSVAGRFDSHDAPAAARVTANKMKMQKCVHFAEHFDGRDGAPLLYRMYRPMEEIHGFHKSH